MKIITGMNKRIIYSGVLAVALFFTACKKFLDVVPSTQSVNPVTITDFQEMLNSDSLSICNFFLLDLMSDDVHLPDKVLAIADDYFLRAYLWKPTIWNPADVDNMYNSSYTRILQMNIILSRVNAAPADSVNTAANRSNVISQSLINRAWYYLQLVNIYGPAYNKTTAAADLGVPLVLTPDAAAKPARASVKQVYDQVTGDLRTALNNSYLPAKGSDIIHPGKAAAYALMARAYLYMASYDSAALYADSSLALASSLKSYASGYIPTQLRDLTANPEILLGRVSYEQDFYALFSNYLQPSTTLYYTYLGAYDYRYINRFLQGVYRTSSYNNVTTYFVDNSVGVPEMMLTKAECLARKGDSTGAITLLNGLSAYRLRFNFPITGYTAANTLGYVLAERRRELFIHGGLRLFDLKRLNLDATHAIDLQRKLDDSTVVSTLPALSSRYVMPFSQLVLSGNANIVQNARQ